MNFQLQKMAIAFMIGIIWHGGIATANAQESSAVVQEDPIEALTKEAEKALIKAIYDRTLTAKSASDFTEFIAACHEGMKQKISDKNLAYLKRLEAWGYYRRGICRCDLGKFMVEAKSVDQANDVFDKATSDLEKSLELDPKGWRPTLGIGLVRAERGDHQGAIVAFSEICEAKPKETVGWFNRAEMHYQLGQYSQASADYGMVMELVPDDFQAITGLAHCKFKNGDFSGALEGYQIVATMMPKNVSALINVGDAQQMLGNWKDAYDSYFAAMSIKATSAGSQKAAWLMATCPDQEYFRPEIALQLANKAIELGGDTRQNLDTLAAAQAANNDFSGARDTQELAMAKLPNADVDQVTRMAMYKNDERFVQGEAATASTAELLNPLKPKSSIRE